MILHIMAVRDAKSESFGSPFFVKAVGQATRSFADEINRAHADNQMYNHPGDFALFQLGKFNDETGEFDGHMPKLAVNGSDVSEKIKISSPRGSARDENPNYQ